MQACRVQRGAESMKKTFSQETISIAVLGYFGIRSRGKCGPGASFEAAALRDSFFPQTC